MTLTVNIPFSDLVWGLSTATPLFLATLRTATSAILLNSASLPESSVPEPIAFARNSAALVSSCPFRCAGSSPPIEDSTLAADC